MGKPDGQPDSRVPDVHRRLRRVSGKRQLPLEVSESPGVRAPRGGLFRAFKTIGAAVEKGDLPGIAFDPFGDVDAEILASTKGLMIGHSHLPIVNKGVMPCCTSRTCVTPAARRSTSGKCMIRRDPIRCGRG